MEHPVSVPEYMDGNKTTAGELYRDPQLAKRRWLPYR